MQNRRNVTVDSDQLKDAAKRHAQAIDRADGQNDGVFHREAFENYVNQLSRRGLSDLDQAALTVMARTMGRPNAEGEAARPSNSQIDRAVEQMLASAQASEASEAALSATPQGGRSNQRHR